MTIKNVPHLGGRLSASRRSPPRVRLEMDEEREGQMADIPGEIVLFGIRSELGENNDLLTDLFSKSQDLICPCVAERPHQESSVYVISIISQTND